MIDIKNFKETFTASCGFRLATYTDSQMILNWRNADHIRKYMHHQDVIPLENHEKWFLNILESTEDLYFIYHLHQRPIGLLCFNKIHGFTAEWGFYLGETRLPQGTGTDMLKKGIDLAFNHIQLQIITAKIIENNTHSVYLHKKIGFQHCNLLHTNLKNKKSRIIHVQYCQKKDTPSIT